MTDALTLENQAWLGRVTCGWKKPGLPLDDVLRYWRDVHSPAIARRPGIWEYRHFQFGSVSETLFAAVDGIAFDCPLGEQLMWTSDVRYADAEGLAAFGAAPDAETRSHLLGDIELIVDQSTTYRVLGDLGHTFVDNSGTPAPQGPPPAPAYALFFRRRSSEVGFRAWLTDLATRWSTDAAVVRLRLSLFETLDMEAERASGYPIKTHPADRQYQAWIDITVTDEATLARLVDAEPLAAHVTALHAYPVRAVYTSNRDGRPTFVGLRGYPAYAALTAIGGYNQAHPTILNWMYGAIADGVTLDGSSV